MSLSSKAGAFTGEDITRGILLTVLSVVILGVQDAIAKVLVQTWSPFQIVMMRYWAFALFSLLLVSRQGPLREAFKSAAPGWQVARGLLLVADVWMFAIAIKTVPLGELHAILLLFPLLVTVMAVPLLGEKVGLFRIGAVIVGFGGALVILRPGGLPMGSGTLFALGCAIAFGGYVVATRKVAQVDSTATNMLYVGVIGAVLTSAVGVFYWTPMTLEGALLVFVVMATMIAAHSLMMMSLRYAPASVLQPFNYLTLPWTILLSFVVFGHLIDPISLVGSAIVAGAGLTIWWRERVRKVRISPSEISAPSQD